MQPEDITSESNDRWQISRWLGTESKARTYSFFLSFYLSLSRARLHGAIRYRDVRDGDKLPAQPSADAMHFHRWWSLLNWGIISATYAPRLSLIDKFDGSVVIYYRARLFLTVILRHIHYCRGKSLFFFYVTRCRVACGRHQQQKRERIDCSMNIVGRYHVSFWWICRTCCRQATLKARDS